MSFEKDSLFNEEIGSKKTQPPASRVKGPPKKKSESLDDLFGDSGGGSSKKKDGPGRMPVKTW